MLENFQIETQHAKEDMFSIMLNIAFEKERLEITIYNKDSFVSQRKLTLSPLIGSYVPFMDLITTQ